MGNVRFRLAAGLGDLCRKGLASLAKHRAARRFLDRLKKQIELNKDTMEV